jgi:hypothetical protein
MLRYKPNFCCNCGEKIERLDWPFWSGRRFCELCETDYWLYDAAPMLVAGVLSLLGVLGFAGVFRGEQKAEVQGFRSEMAVSAARPSTQAVQGPSNSESRLVSPTVVTPQPSTGNAVQAQPKTSAKAADQPVYTCGAMTKKGTACTRRVKGAGERCWQHKGMPALEIGSRP